MKYRIDLKSVTFFLMIAFFYSIIFYIKFNSGYMSPDEIFFTSNVVQQFSVDTFKYYLPILYFSYIYELSPIFLLIINVSLVFYFIKFFDLYNVKGFVFVFLIFSTPSTMYYASSFVRDFYVYLLVFYLLYVFTCEDFSVLDKVLMKKMIIVFLLLLFIKPEIALVIAVSIFLSRYFVGNILFLLLSFFVCVLIVYLFVGVYNFDSLILLRAQQLERSSNIYELGVCLKYGVGDMFIFGWLVNGVSFSFTGLCNTVKSAFDVLLLVESIFFVLVTLAVILSLFDKRKKNNSILLYFVYFSSFFVSVFITNHEAAIRYSLPYKVAMLMICFNYVSRFRLGGK